jgi:hypothetical protein
VIFQKCRDSTIKLIQLSNHSSIENVPKRKSVEFSKIYNYALSFKRSRTSGNFSSSEKLVH